MILGRNLHISGYQNHVSARAHLVDWSVYVSELNFQLQAENRLVQQVYSHVKTFQA